MKQYGQDITYSPLSAPGIFTGSVISYHYDAAATEQDIPGAAGDFLAEALHSLKAELSFSATVTSGSTNFLDLSDCSAAIVVDDDEITEGTVLVTECVERWELLKEKICSIKATHYPDMVLGEGALAPATLSAFTPAAQTLTGLLFPGSDLIYSTIGLTHAAGVIQSLTLTQTLKITEFPPSPAGLLVGAATSGYKRKIELELLATAAIPAIGSVLVITGAPAHAGGYRISSAKRGLEREKGKMYNIGASWIPAFAA